jgi:hypothetical protein
METTKKKARKTTNATKTTRAKTSRGTAVQHAIPEAPAVMPAAPSPAPPAPRPLARMRRATATPAQRRGADLVRYLRIHVKRPYGRRGEEAIRRLAVEVGHLANLELNARAATEGGR